MLLPPPWWDERSVSTRPPPPPQLSAEAARSLFVRNRAKRDEVYVLPAVLSAEHCEKLSAAASACAHARGGWSSHRHSAYPTRDIQVKELTQDVQEQLLEALNERVLRPMAQRAGFDVAQLHYRDLFVVSYTTDAQPGLALHRDGSLLSFNVLLSSPTDFVGGGTRFPHIDAIMRPARGDAVVHSGSALHEGVPITDGTRLLLVGFVDSRREIESPGARNK